MNRREFVLASASTVAASMMIPEAQSQGVGKCWTVSDGGRPGPRTACRQGITLPQVQAAYDTQKQELWCWAATISMVFQYYGYRVSQQQIVNAAYGGPFNWAASGSVISRQLNREWRDDVGRRFRVKLDGLYDFDEKIRGVTNKQIIDALAEGRPLIYGNSSHAMLLGIVDYYSDDLSWRAAGFADPWPGNGLRGANPLNELFPMDVFHPMLGRGLMRYLAIPTITSA